MASGALGEAAVLKELIKQGYTVFTQFDGQSPFDLVAYKDNKLYKVSVKSTAALTPEGSYSVHLAQESNSKLRKRFNGSEIDILAVYVIPYDVVLLFESKNIKNTRNLRVRVPT